MKISELWLREWVNPTLSGSQLATQLTMAGLEVDALHPVADVFSNVVVAKVLQTKPHPQADRLTLCDIDDGSGSILKVVCGASNVRNGLTVALAKMGAHLGKDLIIKESKLRGELSQGMLCSQVELGIADQSEGIMELPDDAPLGVDLREYLMLDDQVLDLDLTPNRADCFSVLGVAREIAALNQLPFSPIPPKAITPTLDETLSIKVHAMDACPAYCGRIIRGINPQATTPLLIKERLRRSGLRSIHPVVDVMNYVMLEIGQPMHAFDLQTLTGGIQVRFGHPSETIKLLNEQEITLNDQVLVIADDNKALAIAGIMGSEASAVQDHTTDLFLESAFFNPLNIAGVARHYALHSDASLRYERGVSPTLQTDALERATQLLQSIVGGQVGPITSVRHAKALPKPIHISFQPSQVQQLTGVKVGDEEMISSLTALGMTVDHQKKPWSVTVPAHRFDLELDVDLVEEIIRLHGYDHMIPTPMKALIRPGLTNPYEQLLRQMTAFFSHRGYCETITYSFVDPELQQALYPESQSMQLINPISSELSVMRVGLWPGLLASTVYNAHRQQTAIKCFEAGVVFDMKGDVLEERPCFAGLITGTHGELNWSESTRPYDFFDLKGDLQSLLDGLSHSNVHFVSATHPALHPGQTAQLMLDTTEIGWIGVLHPRLMDALDLTNNVILFELNLKPLCQQPHAQYQPISKYPQIKRDLSLLVDREINAAQIEKAVRDVVASNLLKSFDVFDVYTGSSIPEGKKSVAIALILQDDHRTLVDAEINSIISAILTELDKKLGIQCRAEATP